MSRFGEMVRLNGGAFADEISQQVQLPQKCLLNEVLLWVAFQRVPVAMTSPEEGKDIRDAEEDMFAYAGYTGDLSDWGTYLEDIECAAVVYRQTREWQRSQMAA